MGLEPGAPDGGWLQPVEVVGVRSQAPETVRVSRGGDGVDLRFIEDYVAFSDSELAESRTGNAEVVFVGYGIVAPEYDWDDYKGAGPEGQGPARDEQRSRGRPAAVRGQDPALLRPVGLQVRAGGAPGRRGRHRHPHDTLRRLRLAGGADLEHRRGVLAAGGAGRDPPAREGLGHRGRVPQDRPPRRPRPRRAPGRRPEARFPARAPGRHPGPDPQEPGARASRRPT